MDLNCRETAASFIAKIQDLYDSGIQTDFFIAVTAKDKPKVVIAEFPVHSLVLAARSRVFLTTMTTDMTAKAKNRCEVNDIDEETMKIVIDFLYFKLVIDRVKERPQQVFYAAQKYELQELRKMAVDVIAKGISQDNFGEMLSFAMNLNANDLAEEVINFCVLHYATLIKNDAFYDIINGAHGKVFLEMFNLKMESG